MKPKVIVKPKIVNSSYDGIPAPSNYYVEGEPKVVLFNSKGEPLIRKIGFSK